MALYGRDAERAALGALLEDARASGSGVLVISGEAGAGKTALLEDAAARAAGMRVLRATGVRSEAELAFAALHQLLWPLRPLLGQLAPAQATALHGALGWPRRRRRIVSWRAWAPSNCSPPPRSSRCCASWTTPSGWTAPRPTRSHSPRAGCTPMIGHMTSVALGEIELARGRAEPG